MIQHRAFRASARVLRALPGLSRAEFDHLVPAFAGALQTQAAAAWQDRVRRRRAGGGHTGYLPTVQERRLFILVYVRLYPIQELQALLFGLSQPQAHYWIHTLLPVLRTALGQECALPARPATTLEDLQHRCPALVFLLDATERPIQRPQDDARQRRHYSGKKKRPTVKNTVVTNARGPQVAFVGATASGSRHDKTLAEDDAPPFPPDSHGAGDLGYQELDPPNLVLTRPLKTPRGGTLTEEERACNRRVAQLRIPVEHAIRGIKIHRVTADVLRATKDGFADLVVEVAAGLFNDQNCRRGYASVVGS